MTFFLTHSFCELNRTGTKPPPTENEANVAIRAYFSSYSELELPLQSDIGGNLKGEPGRECSVRRCLVEL